MKVRPRSFTMLQILDWKFTIMLDPRQKWEVTFSNGKYNISRDNVTLNFSKEEFEKYFREVEQMAELQKCPMCGSEVKGGVRLTGYMMMNRQYIKCDACGLKMETEYGIDGLSQTHLKAITEDLVQRWNNRATEADIRAKAYDRFLTEMLSEFDSRNSDIETHTGSYVVSRLLAVAEQLKGE